MRLPIERIINRRGLLRFRTGSAIGVGVVHANTPSPIGGPAAKEQIQPGEISAQKNAFATDSITTTSTTFTDATDMSVTLTAVSDNTLVLILFDGIVDDNGSGAGVITIILDIDDSDQAATEREYDTPNASASQHAGFHFLDATPTAASHTYKTQWKTDSNTGRMKKRGITAIELRR